MNNQKKMVNNASQKYSIEVNEEQAKILSLALDIYSRMEGGQLEWVFSMIPWKYYENLKAVTPLLKELQQLLTGVARTSPINVTDTKKLAQHLISRW